MSGSEHRDTREGFLYAGAAYFIWGFLPLYMKALAHVPAWEVVPHRVLWSLPIALLAVWWQGRGGALRTALTTPRTLAMALLTATLISVNWGIYVWAIGAGRALETALGYYVNPLFSVFLAAVLIGERLNRPQVFAIVLAALAVALLTWEAGGVPWVSIVLTVTWGFYAYFKRILSVEPTLGFLLEITLLTPIAVVMYVWFEVSAASHFLHTGATDTLLLAGAGLVTAVPLMLYATGAKLLRLSTIAVMQYSAPTMIFLIAVFVFDEPFGATKLVAFSLIWAALVIYTWTLIAAARRLP
ncbi:MAG: EamA family transporter RarD [Siculibacillus sp.]|nr:EamA family transporter RarD [Siculibacillus sp.]